MEFSKKGGRGMKSNKAKGVPVSLQSEMLECGAVSLSMILEYYGKTVPIEELRIACGVSRDGARASSIISAAEKYGLMAEGIRISSEKLASKPVSPCILFWEGKHFVVFCGIRGRRYAVNDPSDGKVYFTKDEFDRYYSGICLTFVPGPFFEKSARSHPVRTFLKKKLSENRKQLITIIILSLLSSVINIAKQYFDLYYYDSIIGKGGENLLTFILLFVLFSAVCSFFAKISSDISYFVNGRLDVDSTTSLFEKILKLPLKFFSQRSVGSIVKVISTSSEVSASAVNTAGPLAINIMMMGVYLVIMIFSSRLLSLIILISFIINIALNALFSRRCINSEKLVFRDRNALYAKTVNGIGIIETIKALGMENNFLGNWSEKSCEYTGRLRRKAFSDGAVTVFPSVLKSVTNAAVISVGVIMIIRGEYTIGFLTAFTGFAEKFLLPAETIIMYGRDIRTAMVETENIDRITMQDNDPVIMFDDDSDEFPCKLSGNVSLNDVSFSYSPTGVKTLKNISMEIKAGQCVAIVGASGCGKSTVSKLISGLYLPDSGSITFDGKTAEEIPHSVFTGSVAIVDQEIRLFEDTVKNNIKLWDESVEDFAMIVASNDACLRDAVMKRPDGFDTKLSANCEGLSGGEKQRLEIARALSAEPTILILDEAFSALDALTEAMVMKKIREIGMTCIMIAHRLSTVRDCDCIYVLDNGEIAESGTHDELIAKNGIYRALVTEG